METYVKMTLDEFNKFKETREQPSQLLQDTIENLTAKLTKANREIEELKKENSMYAIGGMKKRHTPMMTVVTNDGTSWKGNDTNRLKTYVQEYNRLSMIGEDYSAWHVDNLAEELSRTKDSVKAKARAMGYKIQKGYIVRK